MRGELPEFPDEEAPHADLDCALCHGEPPEVKRRNEQVCRVCHGADFVSEDLDALRRELRGLGRRIEERLTADPVPGESALESARRALELLRRDASLGVHDAFLVRGALEQAADALGVER